MKKLKTILSALVMGVVAISLTGCQNEEETYAFGKGISFNCTSESHGTRAAYSGLESGQINWSAGDMIRIYCEQSNKPASHYSDYAITGTSATGSITNVGKTDSLCWGNNVAHTFYAVYPSPESPWVSSIAGKTVTGTVQAAQNGDGRFSDGMVMVAKNVVPVPSAFDKSAVFLDFQPITTAIKFSITNGQSTALTVTEVELKSNSHPLSGTFSYNIGEGKVKDLDVTTTEKAVSITKNASLSASKGNTYEFIFFLRPDDNLDDLSLVVTTSGTTYTSKLQTESGAFTFESGKKYVINGVVLEKWLTLKSITSLSGTTDFREDETVEEEILF